MTRPWQLGDVFVLRHAGFPFDWLEELGFSENTFHAADEVIAAEDRLCDVAGERSGAIRSALDQGRTPTAPKGKAAQFEPLLTQWREARERLETRVREERQSLRERLHARARDEQIQEAVFLSNPAMFDNVLARYVAAPLKPDSSDARRVERQVYTYLQRLCGKNETTSFFGPMGYGETVESDQPVQVTVGPRPLKRRTFCAYWALTEIAKAVARTPALRPHIPVRLNPIFVVGEEAAECTPLGLRVALDPDRRRVLEALVTHGSPARAATPLELPVETVERAMIPLLKGGVLLRGLKFEAEDLDTLANLRQAICSLPEGEPRALWISRLDSIASRLESFAAGDFTSRRALLTQLEKDFTDWTGVAARRGEGQVYSDRLIIYEEARSPFTLLFSTGFMKDLSAKVSDALELSAAYGERVQQAHRTEVAKTLGPTEEPIDLLTYAVKTRPAEVSGSRFSPVPPLELPELEEGRALEVAGDHWGRGEDGARYALPDVCLAGPAPAPGASWKVILSRVHHHMLIWGWLGTFFDRSRYEASAVNWLEKEPGAAGIVGLSVRRRNKGFYRFPGTRVSQSVTDAADLADGSLTPRDVFVKATERGPQLLDRDGKPLWLYMSLDDFSHYPPFASLAHPQVLHAPFRSTGSAGLPRVEVGGATYQRRRWERPTSLFDRAGNLEMLLAVRRASRDAGWGRFVFVRSNTERKPYLIDTQCPFALEILRHLARNAERLTLEEMLPAPDDLWLRDDRGRYTFELRMQAERWTRPT